MISTALIIWCKGKCLLRSVGQVRRMKKMAGQDPWFWLPGFPRLFKEGGGHTWIFVKIRR